MQLLKRDRMRRSRGVPVPAMQRIDVLVGRFAALFGLALCVVWLVDHLSDDLATRPDAWWSAGAYVLSALLLACAVLSPYLSTAQIRALWLAVPVLGFLLQATTFSATTSSGTTVLPTTAGTLDTPSVFWETGFLLTSVYLCFLVLLLPDRYAHVSINLIALGAAFVPWISYVALSGEITMAMWGSAMVQYSNVLYAMLLIEFRRRMMRFTTTQERWRERVIDAARAQTRLKEERELARVVHDNVLGLFNAALLWSSSLDLDAPASEKHVPPALKTMAQESLRLLERSTARRVSEVEVCSVLQLLEDVVHLSVDDAIFDVVHELPAEGARDTLPTECANALIDAVGEAMRNVSRHAGRNASASVTGSISSARVEVIVEDDGVGFEPGAISADRLGLRSSVLGRMGDLAGGSAVLESSPGSGTRITLLWVPEESPLVFGDSDKEAP